MIMKSGIEKRTYAWTGRIVPAHERILRRLDTTDPIACWDWPGAACGRRLGKRYGYVMTGSRSDGTRTPRLTHVVLFEHFVGLVPEGLELDHLCKRPICCNPSHMEPVTGSENCKRAAVDRLDELREHLVLARAVWAEMRKVV